MYNEIKRYELVNMDNEELINKLSKLGFKDGSWQRQYNNKHVMSKLFPLYKSIEVHITINIDSVEWDDYKDVLVLDDNFCQAYQPFYGEGKLDYSFKFLRKVINAYNNVMDTLVNAGIFRIKDRVIEFNTVVRDKVVTQLESDGYECKYRKLDCNVAKNAMAQKICDAANDFKNKPSLDRFIDIIEAIEGSKKWFGYKEDDVDECMMDKRKGRGSYYDCVFLENARVIVDE